MSFFLLSPFSYELFPSLRPTLFFLLAYQLISHQLLPIFLAHSMPLW